MKKQHEEKQRIKAVVIVAHPDDETLWAGGTILMHRAWKWHICALCRGEDPDRAPKFRRALEWYGARGSMGNLDDGPEQTPLATDVVRAEILSVLPGTNWDIILTHDARGEYTRHRRHEETGAAFLAIWKEGLLSANRLWTFAYTDNQKKQLPHARDDAHTAVALPQIIWKKKYDIITTVYHFPRTSFEARTTPRTEAFHCLTKKELAVAASTGERAHENSRIV